MFSRNMVRGLEAFVGSLFGAIIPECSGSAARSQYSKDVGSSALLGLFSPENTDVRVPRLCPDRHDAL